MKNNDIIIVGSGIAGLISAIVASKEGLKVSVLSHGNGVISIGGGSVDLLGYFNNKLIKDNPFNYISSLSEEHPYKLIGEEFIKDSIDKFIDIVEEGGLKLSYNDNGLNKTALTIIGTFRPTYLSSNSTDVTSIFSAKKVAIVTVDYLKDCKPKLIIDGLRESRKLADKEFSEVIFSSPFGKTYRSLNALDISRYVDTDDGYIWLKEELDKIRLSNYDIIILPPILGVLSHSKILELLKDYEFKTVEMSSIPPGVGGFRLREALYKVAKGLGVTFIENCFINGALVEDKICLKLLSEDNNINGGRVTEFYAKSFIIATGGILGGGIDVGIDRARESIFGLDIDCPKDVEGRSVKDVFGEHKFASIGVKVNSRMSAIDNDNREIFKNVFFAGKILAGYDFAKEKSGYAVAITSAMKATSEAVKLVNSLKSEGR